MSELQYQRDKISSHSKIGWIFTVLGTLPIIWLLTCLLRDLATAGFMPQQIRSLYSYPVLSWFWAIAVHIPVGTLQGAAIFITCLVPLTIGAYFRGSAGRMRREIAELEDENRRSRLREHLGREYGVTQSGSGWPKLLIALFVFGAAALCGLAILVSKSAN